MGISALRCPEHIKHRRGQSAGDMKAHSIASRLEVVCVILLTNASSLSLQLRLASVLAHSTYGSVLVNAGQPAGG